MNTRQGREDENPMFSNSIDRLKESFLYATAQGGNAQDCESLLSIGADVNWKGQDGATPLLAACKRGHKEAAAVLLVHGADGNAACDDAFTALHVAARRGDLNMVNLLLNSSVNSSLKTRDGHTAFDIAKKKGHEDICQRLIQYRHNPTLSPPTSSSSMSANRADLVNNSTGNAAENGANSHRGASHEILMNNNTGLEAKEQADHKFTSSGDDRISGKERTSLTMEAAAKLAEETSYQNTARPSSKAQDKREDMEALTSRNLKSMAAPPKLEESQSYSLSINSSSSTQRSNDNDSDVSSIKALKRLLDQANANLIYKEKEKKKENGEYEVLRLQFEEVMIECAVSGKESLALKEQLLSMKELVVECNEEISLLRGEKEAVRELTTVEDCDRVEKALKASLQSLEEHKTLLIQNMLAGSGRTMEEQNMCVVCQANEKSVVLLPCRHVCLCKKCSSNDHLANCPLCREKIVDRINVFM